MTNYTVEAFANFDDFEIYVEALPTTTDIQVVFDPKKGYVVIVG